MHESWYLADYGEIRPISYLVPNHDAEAVFAERLAVPLEERRVLEWLITALHPTRIRAKSSQLR